MPNMSPPAIRREVPPQSAADRRSMGDSQRAVTGYYREVQQDYSAWSPQGYMHFGYWQMPTAPWSRQKMLEAMNNQVFEALQMDGQASGTIADLGCGLGAVSSYGASRWPALQFEGVTISPEQVAESRRRFCHSNLHIQQADYHHMPWADDQVAGAFFLESLCHSTQPEVAFAETFRVLQPGQRLVVVDGLFKRSEQELPHYFRQMSQFVAQSWAVPRFHSLEKLHQAAAATGFRRIQTRDLSFRIAPSVAHAPALTALHACRLLAGRHATRRQWRHLAACGLALLVGLHRPFFGYYLLVFEKPQA